LAARLRQVRAGVVHAAYCSARCSQRVRTRRFRARHRTSWTPVAT